MKPTAELRWVLPMAATTGNYSGHTGYGCSSSQIAYPPGRLQQKWVEVLHEAATEDGRVPGGVAKIRENINPTNFEWRDIPAVMEGTP